MYLAAAMSPNPVCLHPGMTLLQARDLAAGTGFRHFPVADAAGRLVGMVSDRDLRSAFPSTVLDAAARAGELERLGRVLVESIMSRPPITLPRDATLDDALLLFDRHRVGALAVVGDDGAPAGIVTVRDVLGAYRRLFGIGVPGSSHLEVRDDGRPQLMSRIAEALERAGTACTRLVRAPDGPAVVYARVQTINLRAVHEALRAAGLEPVTHKPGAPGR